MKTKICSCSMDHFIMTIVPRCFDTFQFVFRTVFMCIFASFNCLRDSASESNEFFNFLDRWVNSHCTFQLASATLQYFQFTFANVFYNGLNNVESVGTKIHQSKILKNELFKILITKIVKIFFGRTIWKRETYKIWTLTPHFWCPRCF